MQNAAKILKRIPIEKGDSLLVLNIYVDISVSNAMETLE